MGNRYTQIIIEERCDIARLQAAGTSIRQIAASLDRAPSTIARELKRNSSPSKGYNPSYAQQRARSHRWVGSRLDRVLSRLAQGWSPEQVAGRLAYEQGTPVISYETTYRFIYAQLARTKDYSWRHYLPRAKSKRGRRGRKGGSPARLIHLRRPLSERPEEANDRKTPGHWEGDLMLFGVNKQPVLALHERQSRLLIAARPPASTRTPWSTSSERYSPYCRPHCAGRSPWTTAPSSRGIISSTHSGSRPSSVTRTLLGRRAASRTPSVDCAALCRARPTSRR